MAVGDNIYADPHYIYGGDSGEFPHSGCFCVDGLVYPDRRPHTGLIEYKNVIKPFSAEYTDGVLKIKSLRHFTSLSDLSLYYTVEKNGRVIKSECLGPMNIAPMSEASYELSIPAVEYTTLNLSVRQNTVTPWADIGYEVGSHQFILSDALPEKKQKRTGATVTTDDKYYTVKAEETEVKIGKYSGLIESLISNGKQMIPRRTLRCRSRWCAF